MIKNTLVISTLTNLDNAIWERLLLSWPAMGRKRRQLEASLAASEPDFIAVMNRRARLACTKFTMLVLVIYVVGICCYKVGRRRCYRCPLANTGVASASRNKLNRIFKCKTTNLQCHMASNLTCRYT
eukprot:scaffold84525_cov36-Prasinocladus_malaysianus.AAC.1